MNELRPTAGELYLEKARSSGLMKRRKKEEFEAVAEMLDNPYSWEQAKAQIQRGHDKRKEQKEKFKKQVESKWKLLFPNS